MIVFIFSLTLSIQSSGLILDLGSFALGIACQMFVPFIAICYFPWLTKNGIALGIVVGIITVFFTEHIGQVIFGDLISWEKMALTIHSGFWGILFNFISAISISFITQETKENNYKNKVHEFFDDHKNFSISRRSLKPSAWIVTVTWIFFSLGPGLIIGNNMFGNPTMLKVGRLGYLQYGYGKLFFGYLVSF